MIPIVAIFFLPMPPTIEGFSTPPITHRNLSLPSSHARIIHVKDSKIAQIVNVIIGRSIWMCICKGMTDTEVNCVIGPNTPRIMSGGLIGRSSILHWRLPQYGIRIAFLTDSDYVLRVVQVDCQ